MLPSASGKDFLKDMLEYLPAQVFSPILGVIFLPIITRLLSPQEYGYYTLVLSLIALTSAVSGWHSIAIIRFYYSYPEGEQRKRFFGSVLSSLTLTILITAFLLFGLLYLLRNSILPVLYRSLLVGALIVLTTILFETFQSLLRARRLARWYSFFSVLRGLGGWLVGVALIVTWSNRVEGLLWGTLLATAGTSLLLFPMAVKGLPLAFLFSSPVISEMFKYSFPLLIGNLAAWLLSFSDRYVLQLYRGAYEVGLYSAGYRIAESSLMLLVSLFAFAFNPLIIQIWELQGEQQAKQFLTMGTRYFILLCLPATVGLSVLRKPILTILTAPEYGSATSVLPWVTLSIFFFGLFQRYGATLSLHKKTMLSMIGLILCGLINIGLNFAFVPHYGFHAASVTTAVAYFLLLGWSVVVSKRFLIWRFPWESLIRTLIASLGMAVIVGLTNQWLEQLELLGVLVSISIGGLVYLILLVVIGEIQSHEIQAIREILAKKISFSRTRKSDTLSEPPKPRL